MHHIKPTIYKHDGKQKSGKGFSPKELAKAGINRLQARQMGLPVDYRRQTAHDENIENIKTHAEKAKAQAKPKAAPKPETEAKKKAKS
jgi:ribosomal protein L13E